MKNLIPVLLCFGLSGCGDSATIAPPDTPPRVWRRGLEPDKGKFDADSKVFLTDIQEWEIKNPFWLFSGSQDHYAITIQDNPGEQPGRIGMSICLAFGLGHMTLIAQGRCKQNCPSMDFLDVDGDLNLIAAHQHESVINHLVTDTIRCKPLGR